jgi:hypothetical protein
MKTLGLAIGYGCALAALYSFYHFWRYTNKLEEALLRNQIPLSLRSPRMNFFWMIARPGVVPGGEYHRRQSMYGAAVFLGLVLTFAVVGWMYQHGAS